METDREIDLLRERIVELEEDNIALMTERDSLQAIVDVARTYVQKGRTAELVELRRRLHPGLAPQNAV